MKSTKFDIRRKAGKAKLRPGIRRVKLAPLKPVIDAYCARRSDPDEQAPPCRRCRSSTATLWFVDRRTTAPLLVCLDCDTPHQQTTEFPETDIPHEEGRL